AAQPTTPPTSAPQVIPVAISTSAFSPGTSYDLFKHPPTGSAWATLNFAAGGLGGPTFGPTSTNEQYWSDGQHSGSWHLSQGAASLADAAYYDSISAGLRDNVRRQALSDRNGNAYALVTAPVYSASTPT